MRIDRRHALARLCSLAVLAPVAAQLAGCATFGQPAGGGTGRAALLVPRRGPHGNIGENMARASRLAVPEDDPVLTLDIRDTGADAAGATAAARAAGAEIILGPLFGAQFPAVLAASGGAIPVVGFTNDPALHGRGGFVMGVTSAQSIQAILRYARRQGVRRFAVLAAPGDSGRRAVETAQAAATESGLELTASLFLDYAGVTGSAVDGRAELLAALGGGRRPDAVLLPDGGDSLGRFAELLRGADMQLLGTSQWSSRRLAQAAALRGAWFAAPDPSASLSFTEAFQLRHGETPGVLAALAYDAVVMARTLAQADALTRDGLLRSGGFPGVLGDFRLLPDGRCERDLAILTVDGAGVRVIDRVVAA